jgi:hypothetical protein
VLGHELKDLLTRCFSEFRTEVYVVAKIVDPRDQSFQNKQRLIAGQDKLAGVFGQATALKERKRHFCRL